MTERILTIIYAIPMALGWYYLIATLLGVI
jgi:hypothetical protein